MQKIRYQGQPGGRSIFQPPWAVIAGSVAKRYITRQHNKGIEIGYGLSKKFEHLGYMIEADKS
jgi:RimJ/RimL family protein N-acetyltransferase